MRHSTYLWLVMCLLATLLGGTVAFVYHTDPYQVFHPPREAGIGLSHNQRYQNAGLINSWLADSAQGYDSILMGTSLSANFTAADTAASLHWNRALRLLMDGGNPKEQVAVVKHALATQRVKHVLWELQPGFYSPGTNSFVINPQIFPLYLYDNNPFNNYFYFFNTDILEMAWHVWLRYTTLFDLTAETLGYWGDHPAVEEQHRNFNNAAHLQMIRDLPSLHLADDPALAGSWHYPVLAQEMFPVIDSYCNAGTEFIFFIPPVSKADYLDRGDEYIQRVISMPAFILNKIEPCKNIQLHAFDLMAFSNDFNNYKDREHYLPHINTEMLELIAEGKSRLTLDNVAAYEARFRKILNEKRFNTTSYLVKIK